MPVVDGLLGTWVPDSPGTYRVRLRVWDLAGSVRSTIRIVAWNHTPPIANISQSEVIISPNDDLVKQEVRFKYLVQEPVVLDVRIVGPEPPTGGGPPALQRRVVIPHDDLGSFDFRWSGRSDSGALVPDGRYTVYFNGIPFQVDVDVTPPDLGWIHERSPRSKTSGPRSPRGGE